MAQLKSVISQIEGNTEALDKRLIDIGIAKIKLPIVKRYDGSRTGLKGYLIQILLKIKTKASKLSLAGVSTFTIWKLTRPIRVLTATNLINVVKLMLNWTFTALVYVVLISVLLFMVALYIRYYL